MVRASAARVSRPKGPAVALWLLRAPVAAFPSLVFRVRYVEARHDGPPFSRMTWVVPASRVEAVVDQVARQLELGYDRIQPHNAQFLGFD
jgi:hypothetical protein